MSETQNTPPDSSPASAPAAAPDSPPDSTKAPDSTSPASDSCAEIPTAAHAVLTAEIKLILQFPGTDPSQATHKLTLSNDDASYSKTLTFPSDCQPGDQDGTLVMTFDDLTDGHAYSLQGESADGTYLLLDSQTIHEMLGCGSSPDSGQGSDPPMAAPDAGSTTGTT